MQQRLVALAYGLLCHSTFGAAVVVMAFSLFTGLRFGIGPFSEWASIPANVVLIATFPLSHSWLLSPKGRRCMARLVPLGIGSKISTTVFVTISSLQLLAAFLLWSPSGTVWWQAGTGMSIFIGIVAVCGWLLLGKSMADAQLDFQLGLVGWWAVFRNRKAVYKPFSTHGLYRYVRQPIYISFALLLWLTTAWTPDQLVLALAWTGYCIAGAALKERRFLRYFGETFRAYQQAVPFWIPSVPKTAVPVKAGAVNTDADIIIIGAGPIGLLLANLLGKRGHRVIVAERRIQPPKESLAIGITPPSLKILKQLSLDRDFVDQGIPIIQASIFENGKRLGAVDFSRLPAEHRCILSLPQSKTIQLLRDNLARYPSVSLLEGMQFIECNEDYGRIHVRLKDVTTSAHADLSATYLIGCDGHRSAVRSHVRIPFPGHSYHTQFFMADFHDRTPWGAEARLYFGESGSVEAFPLSGGLRRWIIQMPLKHRPEQANLGGTVAQQVDGRTGLDLSNDPFVFESYFRPQRRLAKTYCKGRVLLCGDAAHVMSPIGGQGMNTGFADAAHLDQTLTTILQTPELTERLFADYTRTRRHAFNVAASRAARGMWLGTRMGLLQSQLRKLFITRVLLRPTVREKVARYFAMLTIPGNHPFKSTQQAPGHVS